MSVAAKQTRSRSRHGLHTLCVSALERLTDDAVALTFDVPAALRDTFNFAPGQHVALVRDGGDELRRSYSICSPVGGPLRVAVKRLPGGAFSTYVHEQLRVGDTLGVFPPTGRFTSAFEEARARSYVAIAAGSGITPVLSLVSSALALEPESRFCVIYGNRSTSSIMFLEELEDLKDTYRQRLQLVHVLSREPQEVELCAGRIDRAKLERILATLLEPAQTVDEWFLCGPLGMIETARQTLLDAEVAPARVRRELFHTDDAPPISWPAEQHADDEHGAQADGAAVEVVLEGRHTRLRVPHAGPSILEALLRKRPDAPYACKGGVCGTCRCRLRAGQVRMDHHYALEADELADGVVLACQSHPVGDQIVLDFDAV